MKFATFIDPDRLAGPRLGIVRASGVVDVVAAAAALDRHAPASSVKSALTTGAQTLAALEDLARVAEAKGMARKVDGLRFLPPIPDPSKFFCVGKNSRQHREELKANEMLTEMPTEPTGFIKLVDTMCGQDAEVVRPDGITTLDYEPELVFVIGKRCHRVSKADARSHVAGITLFNDITAREIQKREVKSGTQVLDRQEHAGLRADRAVYRHVGRGRRRRRSVDHLRGQRPAAAARKHQPVHLQDRRGDRAFLALRACSSRAT